MKVERFRILGNVVKDLDTGLIWTRAVLPGKWDWKMAISLPPLCEIGGYRDWRAPTLEERLSINDYTRAAPALDISIFISDPLGWEWTSTLYVPSPGDCAWLVTLNKGYSYWFNHSHKGFVRAVRKES